MIGSKLGPYEISAKLGEGGMGEVFRATDRKLGRDVAIKVLPAHLAADAEALARFEREAQAVAALSHPNILAIFDFGRDGETVYAAMELLEGETLRERLASGALPSRKALEIAAQVARGLAAAHERGIVHRDLKPDNLFLTGDGQVKILDFGLARQVEQPGSKSQLLAAPTQGPGTSPGAVLGTVGYMSPEQVRGETADHRSDIFSLGVVLHEMLTGKRAFARDSAAETMTAILREEPAEIETLAEKLPPSLVRLLQHCLEKRPAERFQSARDLAFDLQSLASGASASERSGRAVAEVGRRVSRPWVTSSLLLLAGAALGALGLFLSGRGASPSPAATSLRPSFRQLTKLPGGEGAPTVAPDGESFVYVKRDGTDLDLFVQRIDGSKAIALTSDCEKDDYDPAFSPDGRTIAFRSECGAGIFVMGATGESRRRVADFGYDPDWSPDGRELALVTERLEGPTSRNSTSGLWAVSIDSGERRRVSEHDAMGPTWSPDGRRIVFWGLKRRDVSARPVERASGRLRVVRGSRDGDRRRSRPSTGRRSTRATGAGSTSIRRAAARSTSGACAVDAASGETRGEPEPVTAADELGRIVRALDGRPAAGLRRRQPRNRDRARAVRPARLTLAAAPAVALSGSFVVREQKLSPDGQWLVFTNEDLPQQLHLVRPDGSGYRQLTEGDRNRQGDFSPDGSWIAFQTSRGDSSLAVIRVDGGGWQALPIGPGHSNPRWSPDGSMLTTFNNNRNGGVVDVRAGFAAAKLRDLPFISEGVLFWPVAWSPDGALLAGRSVREGQTGNIFVHELATGEYRELGAQASVAEDFTMSFVDRRRIVYVENSALWVRDVDLGQPRKFYSAPAGRGIDNLTSSRDGRWLTWIERADESDIWLATLEEAGGPKGASVGAKP